MIARRTFVRAALVIILTGANAVVIELSCSSDMCVPHTVLYHCETDTMNLRWEQGGLWLGGYSFGSPLKTADGFNVTLVFENGGGISSNISFITDGKNGTTIKCTDAVNDGYNCSLIIPPIPVVKHLTFTDLNGTSATLNWTSPPSTAPHCIAMYTVQVNLTNTDTIVQAKETDQLAATVSSLMMNTNYSYRVAGIDNAGRMGEWSDKYCFQLKAVPSISITSSSSTSSVLVSTSSGALSAVPSISITSSNSTSSVLVSTSSGALSADVCLPSNEMGLSSATFASSIVVSNIFSTVTSSLVTMLVMYYFCIKQNIRIRHNEVDGCTENKTSQQVVVYEEVGGTDQTHRSTRDTVSTTCNVAYGKI